MFQWANHFLCFKEPFTCFVSMSQSHALFQRTSHMLCLNQPISCFVSMSQSLFIVSISQSFVSILLLFQKVFCFDISLSKHLMKMVLQQNRGEIFGSPISSYVKTAPSAFVSSCIKVLQVQRKRLSWDKPQASNLFFYFQSFYISRYNSHRYFIMYISSWSWTVLCRGGKWQYSAKQVKRVFPDNLGIIFTIKTICCRYSLESLWQGDSNEYPQYIFYWEL